MCLGIPGQVLEMVDGYADQIALVDVVGKARKINVGMLLETPIAPGDWVLIHMGFAVEIVAPAEAAKALSGLEMMGLVRVERDELTTAVSYRRAPHPDGRPPRRSRGSPARTSGCGSRWPASSRGSASGRSSTGSPPSSGLTGSSATIRRGLPRGAGTAARIDEFLATAPTRRRWPVISAIRSPTRRRRPPRQRVPHRRKSVGRRCPHAFRPTSPPWETAWPNCSTRRPPLPAPLCHLHQLRAAVHHHPALPYDRPATTMSAFAMCERCAAEYQARPPPLPRAADRLPGLRPSLWFVAHGRGERIGCRAGGHPASAGRRAPSSHQGHRRLSPGLPGRRRGGGTRCGPESARRQTVRRAGTRPRRRPPIRRRRHRGGDAVARPPDRAATPRRDAPVADAVAPGSPHLGLLLPYTPLHHLLFAPVPGAAHRRPCAGTDRCQSLR